jgi:flagellar protein FlgJ
MNTIGQEAAVYTDFSQLESLKAEAQANPNAALEEVAQQFESLFMQMMLKSMRDATVKSDLFSSDQMDTYQTMADQQTALSLSQQGGIGLAFG